MDLLEYNVSLIWNQFTFGSIMFTLSETLIKFEVPNMVLTLAFVNVNLESIFYLEELCVWLHSHQDIHHPH